MHLGFYIIAPMKVLCAELYIILLLLLGPGGTSGVNLSDTQHQRSLHGYYQTNNKEVAARLEYLHHG